MSFQTRPFAFDRVFVDMPAAREAGISDSMAIEIETLRTELEQLREDHHAELARARVDGFEAGLTQARNEREAALLSAVDAIQADLESIGGSLDTTCSELTRDAAELALAAAGHIAGRALAEHPANAIDDAIGRALAQVARGTELLIRVHPDLESDITERITKRQAADRRRLNLHVAPDPDLAPGDARIEWDEGGLLVDRAAREAAVREELEGLLAARRED
ncbi:flagellar assembly protein FliH [Stakelama sp. CBK3Z-3]|uniref:Flagellar assembly protein FliH n=1 Tax=Stakelama flava TaxID=2860338 RepID=A0ABS6XKL1_9SPHN|nr:FliH/SctL family protein [Stakelama flava]MBW4330469.1 flagellar assembly protein FliH [Stakelama flava]